MNEKPTGPISQIERDILKLELRLDEGINSLIDSYNPQARNKEVLREQEQNERMFRDFLYSLTEAYLENSKKIRFRDILYSLTEAYLENSKKIWKY